MTGTTDRYHLTPAPGWHVVSAYRAESIAMVQHPAEAVPPFDVHADTLVGWATHNLHEPSLLTGEPVRLLLCNADGPSDIEVWADADPDTNPRVLVIRDRLGQALADGTRTDAELTALCPGIPEWIVRGALRHLVADGLATARTRADGTSAYAPAAGALS